MGCVSSVLGYVNSYLIDMCEGDTYKSFEIKGEVNKLIESKIEGFSEKYCLFPIDGNFQNNVAIRIAETLHNECKFKISDGTEDQEKKKISILAAFMPTFFKIAIVLSERLSKNKIKEEEIAVIDYDVINIQKISSSINGLFVELDNKEKAEIEMKLSEGNYSFNEPRRGNFKKLNKVDEGLECPSSEDDLDDWLNSNTFSRESTSILLPTRRGSWCSIESSREEDCYILADRRRTV